MAVVQIDIQPVTIELFEGIAASDCQKILSNGHQCEIATSDVIFRAGDERRSVQLLIEGRVKVTQLSRDGHEVILWLNSPGQIVGSLTLEPEGTYSSTAQALQPCKMVTWDGKAFKASLDQFPALVRNAQHIIARQYSELSCRIREISTEPADVRLACELIRLARQVGQRRNGHFELDLSQRELAQMTAMSQFTANRRLTAWQRQGLLTRRNRTIVILDLAGLARCAVIDSF
jgi:CRP/FNR family transcriptional regulator, nitrogen oxide reductase regulator